MTESEFEEIKKGLLDRVPDTARRWAPIYKELKWEWNLFPKTSGVPSEAQIIAALNWMINEHIVYPDDVDVQSGGVRVAIETFHDGSSRGILEFSDCVEVSKDAPEEPEEDDNEEV